MATNLNISTVYNGAGILCFIFRSYKSFVFNGAAKNLIQSLHFDKCPWVRIYAKNNWFGSVSH